VQGSFLLGVFQWVIFIFVNIYHCFLWLGSLIYALIIKQCLCELGLVGYRFHLDKFSTINTVIS